MSNIPEQSTVDQPVTKKPKLTKEGTPSEEKSNNKTLFGYFSLPGNNTEFNPPSSSFKRKRDQMEFVPGKSAPTVEVEINKEVKLSKINLAEAIDPLNRNENLNQSISSDTTTSTQPHVLNKANTQVENKLSKVKEPKMNSTVNTDPLKLKDNPDPSISIDSSTSTQTLNQDKAKVEKEASEVKSPLVEEEKASEDNPKCHSKSPNNATTTRNRVMAVNEVVTDDVLSVAFIKDKNNVKKVWCVSCKRSYVPREGDLRNHLESKKHIKKKTTKTLTLDDYNEEKKVARAEILISYLICMRSMSFLITDYLAVILPRAFLDSTIAQKMTINRDKVKKLIEQVLLGAIRHKKYKNMRRSCSLMFDFSRDISNKNEFVIATTYYDDLDR